VGPVVSAYPRLLTSTLLPAYDRIRQRHYVERRRLLEETQWWSSQRTLDFQWAELQTLLTHVFASVPYLQRKYRAAGIDRDDLRTWKDFRCLPVLTREEVNLYRDELCSTTYKNALLPHATGGSTGTPTRFFRTYESYDWRTAAKDRVYSWSGWRLGERSVYLWGAPVGVVSRRQALKTRAYEAVHRQLVINTFSQDDALWRRVREQIVSFRPSVVVGYVSSLEQFADFLQRTNLSIPQLKGVIAAAEPLFSETRRRLDAAFHAPAFNTYGSREFMSIAGECEARNGLHINAENLVLEAGDETGGPSEILVTDLHNFGMPFVRYTTGDLGSITNRPCDCGRGLPRLNAIEGRLLDVLRTADGRAVPGEFFPHLLKDVPEFAHYRVEQKTIDHIVISAVLTHALSERSRALLGREIGKVFGARTKWEIQQVMEIQSLSSGKRRVTVGMQPRAGF
jgi:phenylacetate-CoA ligase